VTAHTLKLSSLKFFLAGMLCIVPELIFAVDKPVIRFGVLSIAQPSRIYSKWQPFADYMSQELNRQVEIVVPRGFGKMKKAIASGEVDFFYINSYVFYRLKQEGKAVAVAQMENIAGQTTSKSEVFVKRESGINTVADLKGKNVAYVSPMGAGGYLAPRASLYQAGLKSGIDNKESFTKNLSNSIHGVLLGDYDAATMCGVNYKLMSRKIETGELKVIDVSDPYPENVIGGRANLSVQLIKQFRETVLRMPENPEGVELLGDMQSMKIKSFVKYDPKMESLTKELLKTGRI
jgi:phosphonate transport system substrate-binding protein